MDYVQVNNILGRYALFMENEAAVLLIAYKYPATRGAN